MSAASFVEYATSPDLSSDEIYTIELLIEHSRIHIEQDYYSNNYQARGDRREQPDYRPCFPREFLAPSAEYLAGKEWLSLQRIRTYQRPVRTLEAVRHLTNLTGLSLGSNEIVDLEPLKRCPKLKTLHLGRNCVRDTTALADCPELEEIEIEINPVENFSGLASLRKLRILQISSGQLPSFTKLRVLPALQNLHIGSDWFDSFIAFPDLPNLRILNGAHVFDLKGIERFTTLQNIVNIFGGFTSLEPLRGLRKLTHINILESKVQTVEPLSELLALRRLWINTSESSLEYSSLEKLPALHELSVRCAGEQPSELAKFQKQLLPWDVEFRSSKSRFVPSLEINIVDDETFNYYNGKCLYGVGSTDSDEGLLSSELSWLDEQLEAVLEVDFEQDEDYAISFRWPGARSRTVMLLSERAIEAFPRLALGLQEVLCHTRHDWILYFQSDCYDMEDSEFIVWLYPDRIETTKKYASAVRRLATQR